MAKRHIGQPLPATATPASQMIFCTDHVARSRGVASARICELYTTSAFGVLCVSRNDKVANRQPSRIQVHY